MTRINASHVLRKVGITSKQVNLSEIVAIGYNEYGGGIIGNGVSVFYNEAEARKFLEDAPVSREVFWIK